MLEVLYHHAKFGGARISHVEFLSVRRAFKRQCLCARFRQQGVGAQKQF